MRQELNGLNDSLGMKLRINNGVPEWSARGADSWSPFKGTDSGFVDVSANNSSFDIKLGYKPSVIMINGATSSYRAYALYEPNYVSSVRYSSHWASGGLEITPTDNGFTAEVPYAIRYFWYAIK